MDWVEPDLTPYEFLITSLFMLKSRLRSPRASWVRFVPDRPASKRRRLVNRLKRLVGQSYRLPILSLNDTDLLATLRRRGVAEVHLDQLQFESTSAMWLAAQELARQLPSAANLGVNGETDFQGHCLHADSAKFVLDYPEILLWGLNDRLLDVLENYMRSAPALIGVALRKDSPNGLQIGTRQWHIDAEDQYVVKVLVYLNDVPREAGPFEYVAKDRFNPRWRYWSRFLVRFRPGYDCDQGFEKLVPADRWSCAVGQAGTAVIADTAQVFHHGSVATDGERLALIFAYTTQKPKLMSLCQKFFPRADLLPQLTPRLSLRQWRCLMGWRGVPVGEIGPGELGMPVLVSSAVERPIQ
ncbi:MAG: hypothetical protein RLZZ511_1897 [Cyanobacteriota bacterium]